MQILNCQKNNQSGFSLLECILAVGILAGTLASLVALQSSIIFVAQNSKSKLRAVWAMQQTLSQMDYMLDAGGLDSFSESSTYVWPGDKNFSVLITKKDLSKIKPSQFLTTAIKFFNMTSPTGNENSDVERSLAPIALLLDSSQPSTPPGAVENTSIRPTANASNFANIFIQVSWLYGTQPKSLLNGLFLINNNALSTIKLPNLGESKQGGGP